ncbi:hypothetical protein FQA39_LY12820 [Lamprigera yunnana]|nr:hypothetical protein FQA39_LY12820 [Lamprigera yunnana]
MPLSTLEHIKETKFLLLASGMGQPSIAIYATELFQDHNVKKIVRVGTCGTYNMDIAVGTVVQTAKAYSEVNIFEPSKTGVAPLDPKEVGLDVVDMESYALFYVAKQFNVEAQTVLTVTDNIYDHSNDMKPEDRELSTLNIKKSGKSTLTCASKIGNEICGCTIVIRNTLDFLGYYELAKLQRDSHKDGCISQNNLFEVDEVIEDISIKQLLRLVKNRESSPYSPLGVGSSEPELNLETSGNPDDQERQKKTKK